MGMSSLLIGLGLLLTVSCSTVTSSQRVCEKDSLFTAQEGENTTLRCEGIKAEYNADWKVGNTIGDTSQKANCVSCGECPKSCTTKDPENYSAQTNGTYTDLTLINVERGTAPRVIVCLQHESSTNHTCRLEVLRPVEIQSVVVTLHGNWSVTGNTTLLDFEGSNTTCHWTNTQNHQRISTQPTQIQGSGTEGGRFNSTCYLVTSLNMTVGPVSFYVEVTPGNKRKSAVAIKIYEPGNLTNDCPAIVKEGSTLNCWCEQSQDDFPHSHVSWEGKEMGVEEDSLLLKISKVKRNDHHENVYICRSVWGPIGEVVQELNYTLLVAYGPDPESVELLVDKTLDSSSENMTLTCASGPVYPSALFNWSVPCAAPEIPVTPFSSACVVTPEVLANVTKVTCVVSNSEFPGIQVTKEYTPGKITAATDDDLKGDETEEDAKSGLPLWVIIAIVAGLAAICLGIVIVVVVKRRNKSSIKRTRKRSSKNSRDDEFEEHINECYQRADAVRPATANRPEFEEHINECYQSADAVRPSAADSDRPEFEEHINECYQSADAVRPSAADSDRPECEEFINDCYVSADAVTSPSSALRTPKQEVGASPTSACAQSPQEPGSDTPCALQGDVCAQVDKKSKKGS